jgi:hypothetical protein
MLVRDFTRRVGVPSLLDQTPATLRPPVRMTVAAKLLVGVGRPLWAYWVELAGLLLLTLAAVGLRRWLGEVVGVRLPLVATWGAQLDVRPIGEGGGVVGGTGRRLRGQVRDCDDPGGGRGGA